MLSKADEFYFILEKFAFSPCCSHSLKLIEMLCYVFYKISFQYPIKNKNLLIKSCIVLTFVIVFFFLHSLPQIKGLSLGWTALLGAILLLILADQEDMDAVLAHVEWSTLLFFAALFILMESLTVLGLIDFIGDHTESIILSVSKKYQLFVATLLILWVNS